MPQCCQTLTGRLNYMKHEFCPSTRVTSCGEFVGMSAALCMCFLFPAVRQQLCIPIVGRFVFVFVPTCKSVDQK